MKKKILTIMLLISSIFADSAFDLIDEPKQECFDIHRMSNGEWIEFVWLTEKEFKQYPEYNAFDNRGNGIEVFQTSKMTWGCKVISRKGEQSE